MTFPVGVCSGRVAPSSLRVPIEWRQDPVVAFWIAIECGKDVALSATNATRREQDPPESLRPAIRSGRRALKRLRTELSCVQGTAESFRTELDCGQDAVE